MTYIESLIYRFKFGFKYKIGLLPSFEKIEDYFRIYGILVSKSSSDSGVYRLHDHIYSLFQRGETATRYVYMLDGEERAFVDITKKEDVKVVS